MASRSKRGEEFHSLHDRNREKELFLLLEGGKRKRGILPSAAKIRGIPGGSLRRGEGEKTFLWKEGGGGVGGEEEIYTLQKVIGLSPEAKKDVLRRELLLHRGGSTTFFVLLNKEKPPISLFLGTEEKNNLAASNGSRSGPQKLFRRKTPLLSTCSSEEKKSLFSSFPATRKARNDGGLRRGRGRKGSYLLPISYERKGGGGER